MKEPIAPGAITDEDLLVAANMLLVDVLDEALVPSNADNSSVRRTKVAVQLQAVSAFFRSAGFVDVANTFASLAYALVDLNSDTVHPLLDCKKREGRPFSTSEIWAARAQVAIAIYSLRQANKKDAIIAKRLKKYSSLKRLLVKGSKLETAPFAWLRQLESRQVGNQRASSRWANFEQFVRLSALSPTQWELLGNGMLGLAEKSARSLLETNSKVSSGR